MSADMLRHLTNRRFIINIELFGRFVLVGNFQYKFPEISGKIGINFRKIYGLTTLVTSIHRWTDAQTNGHTKTQETY